MLECIVKSIYKLMSSILKVKMLTYLEEMCDRTLNFTVIALFQRSSIPPLSDVLAEIRAQCVQYASLSLQGVLCEEELPRTSPLLSPVLNQSLPRGFLPELVSRTHANHELFNKVGNIHMSTEFKYIILCYQYFSKFYTLIL
jgi:hypothetical protein